MTAPGRYAGSATATRPDPDGAGVGTRYLLPRITPLVPDAPLARHQVVPGDRLDLIAYRYLGDPGAAWRVADANRALDPEDLISADAVGTVLIVPVPRAGV